MKAQLKRLQRESRILRASELVAIPVIFWQTVGALYPSPKNLPEAMLNSNGLIFLVEKISKQFN